MMLFSKMAYYSSRLSGALKRLFKFCKIKCKIKVKSICKIKVKKRKFCTII